MKLGVCLCLSLAGYRVVSFKSAFFRVVKYIFSAKTLNGIVIVSGCLANDQNIMRRSSMNIFTNYPIPNQDKLENTCLRLYVLCFESKMSCWEYLIKNIPSFSSMNHYYDLNLLMIFDDMSRKCASMYFFGFFFKKSSHITQ